MGRFYSAKSLRRKLATHQLPIYCPFACSWFSRSEDDMAIDRNTELEIKSLKDSVRSLKANYPIAASLVKFYHVASPEFQITGKKTVRIKFTPYYGGAKNQLVNLRARILASGNQSGFEPFANVPQTGNGEVLIEIQFDPYSAATVYTVQIYADGTSPGEFSVV